MSDGFSFPPFQIVRPPDSPEEVRLHSPEGSHDPPVGEMADSAGQSEDRGLARYFSARDDMDYGGCKWVGRW
jgi:hypothetical protein